MAINLGALAAGINTFANQPGTVIYQAADPQGGQGCNENCTLPPTPLATLIKPSLSAVTCKAIFNIVGTGSTGVTGASIIVGLNQYDDRTFAIYEEEISCGDDLDFTLFPPVTDRNPIDSEQPFDGVDHLSKFNLINVPWIGGNVQIRVTGLTEDDVNSQLAEPIHIISLDFNNNLSMCTVTANPNDCSICVNPNTSTSNIATFSPSCPWFIDDLNGFVYKLLPGTVSAKITICILAAEVTHNYTACGV